MKGSPISASMWAVRADCTHERETRVIFLLSCSKAPEPSVSQEVTLPTADSAEVCVGYEVEGSFYPGWEYCHQDQSLRAKCQRLPGWLGEGCPSFDVSLEHYLSMMRYSDEVTVYQCFVSGQLSYDVLFYSPTSLDVNDGEILLFDPAGEMIGYIDTFFGGGIPDNCCEGHAVKGWSWGERLDIFCDERTTLPLDPPDTADTADTGSSSLRR
jgi:hypothetical protein